MKYCGYCGAKLHDEFKFCSSCGKNVACKESENEEISQKDESPRECVISSKQINETHEPTSYSLGKRKNRLKYSIMGFAFGVGGLICAIYCMTPIINLFVFLPAFIVLTALSKKYTNRHIELGNRENGFCKAADVVSNVAIPVGCVFLLFGMLPFVPVLIV